jgi:hypothetical protein
MKWVLVVMLAGKAPYDTGMVYNTIDQCYAAEDAVAQSQTDYLNHWMAWARQHPESGYRDPPKGSGENPVFPQFILDRMSRGICAPHN